MHRRSFVASLVAAGVPTVAGCGYFSDNETKLLRVAAENWYEETRTVQIRVEYDGDVVDDETHDIPGNDAMVLDCSWPSEPGEIAVSARTEEYDWLGGDIDHAETGCAEVLVVFTHDDEFQFLTTADCDPPFEPC